MKRRKLVSLLLTTLLIISSGASLMAKAEKKAVVIAAFGTSYPKALSSIINVAEAVRKELPGTEVRIAFTSNIIRKIWHKRVNDKEYRSENPTVPSYVYQVKTPLATIADLQNDGFSTILVQPSHIFAGEEYYDLKSFVDSLNMIKTHKKKFMPFKFLGLGRPALGKPGIVHDYHEDLEVAAKALKADVEKAKSEGKALVYMGHGNEYFSTGIYAEMQKELRKVYNYPYIFVGTVEGYPSLDDVVVALKHIKVKKVLLKPFMLVAGDHANNDMASDEDDSWKTVLESNGIDVEVEIKGLGENPEWVNIYVEHLKDLIKDSDL